MNLVKSTDTQYEKYEDLLLERDQLLKEAGPIWTSYIKEFGKLLIDVYEEKIECVKCKKIISYCQAALNSGGVIDRNAVNDFLEMEMASYYARLRQMIKENEKCKAAGFSTPYEVQRSKTLYRRIAKLIHPDINPETDRNDKLMELWQRAQAAYRLNDVKALSEIEILIRKAMKALRDIDLSIEIPDIEERIAELEDEIAEIKETEPYTLVRYLVDKNTIEKRKAELTAELEVYRKYRGELETVIEDLLKNSEEVTIKWRMN